jgi:hypothetical protein
LLPHSSQLATLNLCTNPYCCDVDGVRIVGNMVAQAVIAAAHSNMRHCVRDWMDSLQHDGTPRIEHFFIDCFGAEAKNAADLGGIEGFPIEDELEYGVHGEKSGLLDRATGADGGGETVEDRDGLLE